MPPQENKTKKYNPPEPGQARALRTFEDDIADAMRKGQGSALGIVLAEQKKNSQVFEEIQEKKSSAWMLVLGILLFTISLCAVGYFVYVRYGTETKADIVRGSAEYAHPVLRADKVTALAVDTIFPKNGNTTTFVYTIGGGNLSSNTVALVTPTVAAAQKVSEITGPDILKKLGTHAPALLVRSVDKDFALGVYSGDTAESFVALKVLDFENAFSGMLEWEKFMSDDLFGLFGVSLPTETLNENGNGQENSTTTNSTTTSKKIPRDINVFVDRTIKNRDVRVVQDDTGKIYFMYGFVGRKTIIMTTSPESYFEILNRLR